MIKFRGYLIQAAILKYKKFN